MVYEIQTIIRLMIETWMIVLWMIVSYPLGAPLAGPPNLLLHYHRLCCCCRLQSTFKASDWHCICAFLGTPLAHS